jgi:glucokinase
MNSKVYLGIDLGGTKVLSAVINAKGQILSRGKKRTAKVEDRDQLVGQIIASAQKALHEAGTAPGDVAGVGIGAPGPVDTERGVVLEMPNIPVGCLHLRSELETALGAPCAVDNDVNVGTLGEFWRGAGQGTSSMVGVFVGTGTGGGIIIDGKLLRGKTGITGEIGHIVLDPDGPECGCGRRGCLEALASRTAMRRRVERAWDEGQGTALKELTGGVPGKLRSGAFRKALDMGDKLATQVVRDCAINLGYGAVTLIHLLSPERIVFGGGVMEALADEMLPIIEGIVAERCLDGCAEGIEIVPAKLGDDAGVLGAAALAIEIASE